MALTANGDLDPMEVSLPRGSTETCELPMSRAILFSTLAGNQTRFYVNVASHLKQLGFDVSFAAFHDPSLDYIERHGFTVHSGFDVVRGSGSSESEVRDAFSEFHLERVSDIIRHEMLFYEVRNQSNLRRKLARYLRSMDRILADTRSRIPTGTRLTLVQELGGVLSVAAGFHAARKNGVDNIFIEPSFFRGRVFFSRNSFDAKKVGGRGQGVIRKEVVEYLRNTVEAKRIVVPTKDALHFRRSLRKVLSVRSAGRLVVKAFEKFILGQREEFNHIGQHVTKHLRMLKNECLLRKHYSEIPTSGSFVYYPLHVPADVALTIRAAEFVDQYQLIERVSSSLPETHQLLIKEHPATIGAIDFGRISDLLKRQRNVILLNPRVNNFDVIAKSDLVVTVNSKSGAESLLLGKRVVALGDSFYRNSGLVVTPTTSDQLAPTVLRALAERREPDRASVEAFFQGVWDASYPGELYAENPGEARAFANSLVGFLGKECS